MAMGVEAILALFGALMVAAAITGGDFEVREIRVPRISGLARFAAGSIGSLSLLLCVGLTQVSRQESLPVKDQSKSPASTTFTVSDRLGTGQISEQVDLIVNGQKVGNLIVNEQYPESSITVHVPSPGSYSYDLIADAYFSDGNGSSCRVTGVGQGKVDIVSNKKFFLNSGITGSICQGGVWTAHLEELQ